MALSRPSPNHRLSGNIARVVIPRRRIARRVKELAAEIARRYGREDLSILAVLTGSLIFLADLMRELPLRMRLDVISVCSYPGKTTRSNGARLTMPLPGTLTGKHVLIVDDILDTGQTLQKLAGKVRRAGACSVRTCVLLDKDRRDLPRRMHADFVGFNVPDEFLVGYGLDFDHLYRNLPDICVLKQHDGKATTAANFANDTKEKSRGKRPTSSIREIRVIRGQTRSKGRA